MTVTFVFPTSLGVVIELPFDPQPVAIPAAMTRTTMDAGDESREKETRSEVAPNIELSSRSRPNVDGEERGIA